jgi:hypothetical protein
MFDLDVAELFPSYNKYEAEQVLVALSQIECMCADGKPGLNPF